MIRKLFRRRIEWQGITVEIVHEPNWLGNDDRALGHLQMSAIDPPRAPLPITETGYRSYFANADIIASAGGPVAFVRAWLDLEAHTPAWRRQQEAARQLSLF